MHYADALIVNTDGPQANADGSSAAANISAATKKKAANSAKDNLIRQLKAQVKDKDAEIADLNQTITDLNEARRNADAIEPATYSGSRNIGTQLYQVLGSGPNAGKLVTKYWKKVFSNGKWFKEWTALSEIKLEMGNKSQCGEVKQIGEMHFWRVPDGEHQGVYVQAVSEHSYLVRPEGNFAKWTLREELPAEQVPRI